MFSFIDVFSIRTSLRHSVPCVSEAQHVDNNALPSAGTDLPWTVRGAQTSLMGDDRRQEAAA